MKTTQNNTVSKLDAEAAKLNAADNLKVIETPEEKPSETPQSEKARIAFSDCKFDVESVNHRISSYQSRAGRVKQVITDFASREMSQVDSKTRLIISYDGASSPLLDAALISRMVKSGALPVRDPQAFLEECRAVVALKKALQTLTA